jgi:hypothetical protein
MFQHLKESLQWEISVVIQFGLALLVDQVEPEINNQLSVTGMEIAIKVQNAFKQEESNNVSGKIQGHKMETLN